MALIDITRVEVGPRTLTARVHLADNAPLMTNEDIEGTSRVYYLVPGVVDHVCLGDVSGTFRDVMGATEVAHLLEHVTVELLALTNIAGDISSGRTFAVADDVRSWDIELSCPDDVLVAAALSSAAWMLDWAFSGGEGAEPDVQGIVEGLVGLVQSLPAPAPQEQGDGVVLVDEIVDEPEDDLVDEVADDEAVDDEEDSAGSDAELELEAEGDLEVEAEVEEAEADTEEPELEDNEEQDEADFEAGDKVEDEAEPEEDATFEEDAESDANEVVDKLQEEPVPVIEPADELELEAAPVEEAAAPDLNPATEAAEEPVEAPAAELEFEVEQELEEEAEIEPELAAEPESKPEPETTSAPEPPNPLADIELSFDNAEEDEIFGADLDNVYVDSFGDELDDDFADEYDTYEREEEDGDFYPAPHQIR